MRGSRHQFASPVPPEPAPVTVQVFVELSKFIISLSVVYTIYVALRPWV